MIGFTSSERPAGERDAASNNGLHPTADTTAVSNLQLAGGRVMPGVRRNYH